jgi:tetratricopeptide (TPR) repeat protein
MAALALGGNKVSAAYDAIAKMTLHDEDAYARRCAAYALGLLGDSKALPVLEQALQDKEDSVKRNAQAAITMLTKLTEMDSVSVKPSKPDKLRAEDLVAEGWTLWRQRKLIEAEQKFEEATAADPTHDGAYQGLGWAQLNQGKRDNAKVSFEKCVALNPQNSAALNGLGWIAYGQDDKDEAIGWWEKAVAAQAGATAALSGLTQVYMERRDYQNAIRCYQMWLKAEPNNQDAKNGLEKARQALAEAKN